VGFSKFEDDKVVLIKAFLYFCLSSSFSLYFLISYVNLTNTAFEYKALRCINLFFKIASLIEEQNFCLMKQNMMKIASTFSWGEGGGRF
jgi:hypothetical protein